MRVIEITEDKVGKLTEHIEKGLRYIGKAMQCLDDLGHGSEYGERWEDDDESRYGERGRYGMRRGMGGRYR